MTKHSKTKTKSKAKKKRPVWRDVNASIVVSISEKQRANISALFAQLRQDHSETCTAVFIVHQDSDCQTIRLQKMMSVLSTDGVVPMKVVDQKTTDMAVTDAELVTNLTDSFVLILGSLSFKLNVREGRLKSKKTTSKFWRPTCIPCFFEGRRRTANYKGRDKKKNRLCADHAREVNTWYPQKPCRDCEEKDGKTTAEDPPLDACYKGRDKQKKKLCAVHAREAKTWYPLNPCRDCEEKDGKTTAEDPPYQAAYKGRDKKKQTLCADHAREAKTWYPQNPCRDCEEKDGKTTAEDPPLEANYKGRDEKKNRLCAYHAREAKTWYPQNPCRDCEEKDAKITAEDPPYQAAYKGRDGKKKKLCADHAREAKTWYPLNPCRDCEKKDGKTTAEDPPLEACYEGRDDKKNKLCADHAKEAKTWYPQNPCRDCEEKDGKTTAEDPPFQANYEGRDKKKNRLCADHAREAKTWYPQNPCRDCQEKDGKSTAEDPPLNACYKGRDGNNNKLCARHAVIAGTLAKSVAGASRVACECWDRLALLKNITLEHIHLRPGCEPTGRERTIPGTKYQADARDPDDEQVLYEFLGNRWHGWPVNHPNHNDPFPIFNDGRTARDVYETTFERFQALKELGYSIIYVWEHEYNETTKAKCPRRLQSVLRVF